jgi:tellurite resistance protein TerC
MSSISSETIFFTIFSIFVLFVMMLDLGIFSKKSSEEVSFKQAGIWSAIWVILAISFYFFLQKYGYMVHGIEDMASLEAIKNKYASHLDFTGATFAENLKIFQKNMSLEYITGYLVEYSLSADNIFVFILILNSFGVHKKFYKKILIWGILGAIVLRFIFIFVGSALLQRFDWIIYIFGAFLVYTGLKLFFENEDEKHIEPSEHPVTKFAAKYFNVYKRNIVDHFFIYHKGFKKWYITPIFIVVLVIAVTDVIFAVDSIPAIFSITKDPYIVFFSNVFAIMGLRSMFFFFSSIMNMFRFLQTGLAVLLTFIGAKMLAHHWLDQLNLDSSWSLFIILAILGVSIGASLLFPEKNKLAEN